MDYNGFGLGEVADLEAQSLIKRRMFMNSTNDKLKDETPHFGKTSVICRIFKH